MRMRQRKKLCTNCNEVNQVLYRCKYNDKTSWKFICINCLEKIKGKYIDTYVYGGTWKGKKIN